MTHPAREATHHPDAPPNSVQTPEGHRWYLHPVKTGPDGDPERFTSMTTALQSMAKIGLRLWHGAEAAKAALEALGKLIRAGRLDPCGKHGDERCGECPDCLVKWLSEAGKRESRRRADEGSKLHFAAKTWIQLGCRPDFTPEMDPEIEPYFTQFRRFWLDFGLTNHSVILSETTVINREVMAAGTLDIMVRMQGSATPAAAEFVTAATGELATDQTINVLIDIKTREKPEAAFYMDHGLQIAGLSRCTHVMHEDGTEVPMPAVHAGMVLQVRPDDYEWRVAGITDEDYRGFVTHLHAFEWQCTRGGQIVGSRTFPLPDEMQPSKAAAVRVLMGRFGATEDIPGLTEAAAKRCVEAQRAGQPWPDEKPRLARKRAAGKVTPPKRPPLPPATERPAAPTHSKEEIEAAKAEVLADLDQAPLSGRGTVAPGRRTSGRMARRSATADADPFALANSGRGQASTPSLFDTPPSDVDDPFSRSDGCPF